MPKQESDELMPAWFPELRGWDEAERITDWPSGFCHGENDYQSRVHSAWLSLGLLEAAKSLRAAQRAYKANRDDRSYDAAVERAAIVRNVDIAAAILDAAIAKAEKNAK